MSFSECPFSLSITYNLKPETTIPIHASFPFSHGLTCAVTASITGQNGDRTDSTAAADSPLVYIHKHTQFYGIGFPMFHTYMHSSLHILVVFFSNNICSL